MRVTIRCEYFGDEPPSLVQFVPTPELGVAPSDVHEAILRMIRAEDYFELAVPGGDPLPFWSRTVRAVAVWRSPAERSLRP